MQTILRKIQIIGNNGIPHCEDGNDDDDIESKNNSKSMQHTLFNLLSDESISTVPIAMKYFAFHECIVLLCGGLYYMWADFGVVCLSIVPGLSVLGIFIHFLFSRFDTHFGKSTFRSPKHYAVAAMVFIVGQCSIYFIYHTNTYLSTLVPLQLIPGLSSPAEVFIGQILQFPHQHSMKSHNALWNASKLFNYRISFVGSIIAPVIEESFKFLLLALTFPIPFIWSFATNPMAPKPVYSLQSLFIIFIGFCGGCGIAIMENIGYLAACQWASTKDYCLPNRSFDILGAGLARGIFSVPFHCVTAGIMADIVCWWMSRRLRCLPLNNKCVYIIKALTAYPLSIVIPVFFHSSYNYWMKGIPVITGLFTVIGFAFLAIRIAKKQASINQSETRKNALQLCIIVDDSERDTHLYMAL